jgi:hypothetical protein
LGDDQPRWLLARHRQARMVIKPSQPCTASLSVPVFDAKITTWGERNHVKHALGSKPAEEALLIRVLEPSRHHITGVMAGIIRANVRM